MLREFKEITLVGSVFEPATGIDIGEAVPPADRGPADEILRPPRIPNRSSAS